MATPSWVTEPSSDVDTKTVKKSKEPSWISGSEPAEASSEEVSYGAGLARAGLQGLSFGFADEIEAFLRKGDMPYEEKLAQVRQAIDQFSEQNPGTALTAEIVGSLPTALLGGAGLARAGVTGAAKVAGLEGALYGFGAGEGGATERAKSAAIGGTVGAVTGKASDFLFPRLNKAASELKKKGVRLTPGQKFGGKTAAFEQKLTSVPFAGDVIAEQQVRATADFNRAAMDNALKVLNESGTKTRAALSILKSGLKVPKNLSGNDAFDFANNEISNAYDKIIPKLSANFDSEFEDELLKILVKSDELGDQGAKQFSTIVNNIIGKTGDRLVSGRQLSTIDSDLGARAINFSTSNSASERELGTALFNVQKLVRDSMNSANSEVAEQYRNVQNAWKTLLPVRTAVANATAKKGVFTPKQLAQASKAIDKSSKKLKTAKGQGVQQKFAQEAEEVLGLTTADLGTADRAALMLYLNQVKNRPKASILGGLGLTVASQGIYGNPLGRGALTSALAAPGLLGRQGAPAIGAMTGRAFEEDQQ